MSLEQWSGEVSARLEHLAVEVKTIRELLQGDTGMVVRVDRLEQQSTLARWIVGVVVVAVTGLLAQAAAQWVF